MVGNACAAAAVVGAGACARAGGFVYTFTGHNRHLFQFMCEVRFINNFMLFIAYTKKAAVSNAQVQVQTTKKNPKQHHKGIVSGFWLRN